MVSNSDLVGSEFSLDLPEDELQADKPLFVPLDMFQQELVLGDVRIREVELHLILNTLVLCCNQTSKILKMHLAGSHRKK